MANAEKFFDENLRMLGASTRTQSAAHPEKYNLYSGIAVMAAKLSELHEEVGRLKAQLQRIETAVRKR